MRVVYQDATTQELLMALRYTRRWEYESIAGGTANNKKWPGAYGFFASAAASATDLIISTWGYQSADRRQLGRNLYTIDRRLVPA